MTMHGQNHIKQIDLEARNCFTFKLRWAGSLPWNSSWLLPLPYRISRRSAISLVVIRLSCITMARVFSTFSLGRAETGRPGQGSSFSDSLPSWKCVNIGRFVHNSVSHHHTNIFQVLVHFRGSFPRFTVKFNHGMLIHFRTFDMCETITRFFWQQ